MATPIMLPENDPVTLKIRPQTFAEFTGQYSVKEILQTAVDAARQRGEAMDHVLLCGPPGLGKTTLAQILSRSMGTSVAILSGPLVSKGDVITTLRRAPTRSFVFIDEVHRMKAATEESLYVPMEDYRLDLTFGSRVRSIPLQPFTLVGATTLPGHLTAPLRDRFSIVVHLNFYSAEELTLIVRRSAGILNVGIEPQAAYEIGCRARGTPRIANGLLRRIRDIAQLRKSAITLALCREGLSMLGIDARGLSDMDRKILRTIIASHGGGPVGLNALAATIGETESSIEEFYEPYLLQNGFIERSNRGRMATMLAYKHLGVHKP